MMFVVSITAVVFYLLASLYQGINTGRGFLRQRFCPFVLGSISVILHGYLLYRWIDLRIGQNLSILNMLSLALWLIAVMALIVELARSVRVLAVFVFPLTASSILLVLLFPATDIVNTANHPEALAHILLSVLMFCALSLAGFLAMLLAMQEHCLRLKKFGWLIQKLPPLESMESLLFQVMTCGFIVLSFVLATSFYNYFMLLSHNTVLIQKTVLAMMIWGIFALLLLGRYCWGWRGRKAIYGTLLGVFLLMIAYVGSHWLGMNAE